MLDLWSIFVTQNYPKLEVGIGNEPYHFILYLNQYDFVPSEGQTLKGLSNYYETFFWANMIFEYKSLIQFNLRPAKCDPRVAENPVY